MVAGFDQAVGVQGEETSLGQFQLHGLERDAQADAEWASGGQVGEGDPALWVDDPSAWEARAICYEADRTWGSALENISYAPNRPRR